ncbi:MAG: PorT family protein, partial [Flavobacteriales bacterium]|nr:PorT family protein [Flavobacteriales bacterium]
MKKAFLALLLFSALPSFAQKNTKIGIKGGANLSQVDIDQSINDIVYQTKGGSFGFHAGAFLRVANNWIFLQPEILFSSTGGKISADSLEFTRIIELTYNKVDVPINLGFRFGKKIRAFGGIVGSLLLQADAKDGLNDAYHDVKQNYALATYGYNVGLGLDLNRRISFD